MASNILSNRLSKLEAAGILTKTADPADARRFNYRLTKKGLDFAQVPIEIVLWSARHEDTEALPSTVRSIAKQSGAVRG
jgi:DNA-binding HxlR family transcriptional regulator